jgi:predicted DNA-binding transcriptional regulator AlpA
MSQINSHEAAAEPSRYVDDRAAADLLGLSRSYMRQLRVKGGGPRYSKLSAKAIRYRVEDLHAWAEAKSVGSTSER